MSALASVGFDWPDMLDAVCADWYHYGSRVTNPEEVRPDSDYDFCGVVDRAYAQTLLGALTSLGFDRDCATKYPIWFANGSFLSTRRGDINIVLTPEQDWFDKHKLATQYCCFVKLDKPGRIQVFRNFGV